MGGYYSVQAVALCAQLLLASSISLLTQATISQEGTYKYKTMTVPLFAELGKLGVSILLFFTAYVQSNGKMLVEFSHRTVFTAAVPGALYFLSNNLNFIIIRELGASNFQLLNNLKVLTTAFFFRLIMKVDLNGLQWRMLLLLTIGCLVSQSNQRSGQHFLIGSVLGYTLKIINSCLTAIGSVYCEKFLKHIPNNFHFQNILLYAWGSLFAIFALLIEGEIFSDGMIIVRGHTWLTFLLICSYTFGGIATSAVIKYLDSIAKTFAATGSSFLVATVSIVKLWEPFRIELIWGSLIAGVAVDVYYHGELLLDKKKMSINDQLVEKVL